MTPEQEITELRRANAELKAALRVIADRGFGPVTAENLLECGRLALRALRNSA